jgi:hypothetical protein
MALTGDTATSAHGGKPAPALKLNFLSHGTLEGRESSKRSPAVKRESPAENM